MALMRGSTDVRAQIETFLSGNMPPYIIAARSEWQLEDWQLPTPARFDAYDPLETSVWPTVGSLVSKTSGWTMDGIVDGAEHYSATYQVEVFLWVKTPERPEDNYREGNDYEQTLRLRDDEIALLRTCLLAKPSLGSDGKMYMVEGTLNEDYSAAVKLSQEAPYWVAGGTLSFAMKVSESNVDVPLGVFEELELDVELMELPTE